MLTGRAAKANRSYPTIVTEAKTAHMWLMSPIGMRQWRKKWRKPFSAFSISTLLLLAAACAPNAPLYAPLQAAGSHGYTDERLEPTHFKVSYTAPPVTSSGFSKAQNDKDAEQRVALAYDMALWRASELALQNGFPAFSVVDRSNDVTVDHRYYYDDDSFYHPCPGPFIQHFHCRSLFFSPPYYERYALISARVTLMIDLDREIRPGTFNAQDAIARLRAHYPMALTAGQPLGEGGGY